MTQTMQKEAIIKPTTEKYDVVIIGSSPMSLVEASFRASKGDKVCIIEAKPDIGGAWMTEECFGLPGIEMSPHVFMPDKTAHKVLKTYLPSEYEVLPDQPKLMIRWSKFFGDFKLIEMNQRYREAWILAIVNNYDKGKGIKPVRFWNAIVAANKTIAYRRKNRQATKLIYPKHGLTNWLKDIRAHLEKLQVVIKNNTKISKVVKNKKEFYLEDQHGVRYEPGQLCYSKMFTLEKLEIDGDDIPLSYMDYSSQHIVYIVKGVPAGQKLPFWRLMKDGYYMFFNDITRYSKEFQEQYPGHRLINTRMYSYRMFRKAELKTYFKHISFVGYLPKTAVMVDWHYKYQKEYSMTYEWEYRFKKLLGKQAYEIKSGTVGLHNGLRNTYGKYVD